MTDCPSNGTFWVVRISLGTQAQRGIQKTPPLPLCCCRQSLSEVRRGPGGQGDLGGLIKFFLPPSIEDLLQDLRRGWVRRWPGPEGTQERVGAKSATEGEARELESKISRLVQFGCRDCFSLVKQEMARVNINILGISELNGLELVDLTQMTITCTTVGKNPLEEME